MKPATRAPIYAALYADLAELCREDGWALAVHGSLARDLDLLCVPWTEHAVDDEVLLDDLTSQFAFRRHGVVAYKPHGRVVYSLVFDGGFGHAYLDLSLVRHR